MVAQRRSAVAENLVIGKVVTPLNAKGDQKKSSSSPKCVGEGVTT